MLVQEFEGKTEKEAIKLALETLKLKEEQIRIEPIEKSKVGFFGFKNRKPVKIKVYYEEQQDSSYSSKAKNFLLGLFDAMGIKSEVSILREEDEKLYLKATSDSSGLIIGKRGKNLEAIQFMLNIAMNKSQKNRKEYKKVVLDIEGYWDKREEAIKKLALRTADAVRATKKIRLLDPMNPFERRLVHLTLQDFNDIGTRSEGEGTYKKVKIFLKR